mgnify:CR=1 FL=1
MDVMRETGNLRVYRKDGTYYCSETVNGKFRRLKVNKDRAETLAKMPQANFVESIKQLIDGAQASGSANYFECIDKR